MLKQKQFSHKHHFVPKFYLRAWYDCDGMGFWLYTRNKAGNIVLKRRPAKSVAYVNDLYSFKPVGLPFLSQTSSDELERNFFSNIDDAAALIHQKLISSNINSLSVDDRRVWSLFINSLLERSPKRIAEIERSVNAAEIIEDLVRRRPSLQLQEILNNLDIGAVVRNNLLTALINYIFDEQFIEYLTQLCWSTFDLPDGEHFLTGDSPVVVNGGLSDKPIHLLSIALSPRRLLVIHTSDPNFDENFINQIAVMHSIQVTTQTEKYLVSSRKVIDGLHIKYEQVVKLKLTNLNI
ncbi:DUF4238 domain-containing protein [Methylomonas albis]|uniref:DUF4238 domain-containing protein n=1 Tax=Methylomonas albis TaxID=1854563 RepID=A0ABR9D014_9GAMM|nr:DUF4238 domain-containing protein [Methylomonas albis]MBD9356464.1 DUF4238 domain-containing protein [Methylomonas albis]